jgi:hypothetical protein
MAMTSTEEEMVKEGILAVVVCAWKLSTRNPFVEGMRMLVGEVVRDFVAMARAWRGHRQATSCLSSGDLRVSVQQGPPRFLRLCLEVLEVLEVLDELDKLDKLDELSPGNTRLRSVTTKLLWLARLDKLAVAEERGSHGRKLRKCCACCKLVSEGRPTIPTCLPECLPYPTYSPGSSSSSRHRGANQR